MIQVDRYIPFLKKNKLTSSQFLLLLLLYQKKYKLIEEYKLMFPTEDGSMIGKYPLDDLIKRGYIEQVNPTDVTAKSYTITTKFSKIFCDKFEAGNQIWDLYPRIVTNEGKNFPLKLWDKNEMRDVYYERINGNYEEHLEVLKDLEYAIENGLIKGKLENFIKSEAWTDIRKERIVTNTELPKTDDL